MSDVKPSAIANAVMANLYDTLTNGDDTVPASEDNFFSWCSVGIPIQAEEFDFLTQGLTGVVRKQDLENMTIGDETPELTPELLDELRASDTARLYMQAESFARLVDFVPDVASLQNEQYTRMSVMNNEGSLSERYKYILRMSQVMQSELPETTKKKLKKLRNLLSVIKIKKNLIDDTEVEVLEDSPLVKIYHEKLAAYESTALEYNMRRINALAANKPEDVHYWALNANILKNRVNAAMGDWVSNGYKNDYEAISAFIDQVMQRDMALLKQEYREDLAKAVITGLASGSDFYFTSVAGGNFTRALGWTKFGFNSGSYNSYRNSSYANRSSSASANASFFGLGGIRGNASNASQNRDSQFRFNSEHFRLKFNIAQVPIVRPWFKTSFLNSQTWRFDQNDLVAKTEMVSDGGNPPKGKIPAYPTSMIIIKDLEMTFGESSGARQFASAHRQSSASGNGSVSFCGFNLGGSYSKATSLGRTTSQYQGSWENNTLKVPGMQVIGFRCHMLPKSPNPLPEITKWV